MHHHVNEYLVSEVTFEYRLVQNPYLILSYSGIFFFLIIIHMILQHHVVIIYLG